MGGSSTTGERNYVDTPSAFVIGEGSDLSIGKVTNTGAVIGTEENSNGKIKIDEYIGKNIDNKDTYNTTGGTISTGGIGAEYQDKEKEGLTHNTVVGNVEIGSSSGDEINTDINKMQETTKDKDSGHYNTFVESGVLELATEKGREKFKESVGLAGEEVTAVGRVIDTVINKQNEDKRDPLVVLGEERQAEKWRNEGLIEDFKNAKTQDEMSEAIEKIGVKEGYEVEVIYSDSSNRESLDGKKGESYIDSNGKIVIVINTEAEGIGNKDVLAGVLAEELSHGINYANGKDKGKGTETLAEHSNDYFSGKLGGENSSISIASNEVDYNNINFGEHVGDKAVLNTDNDQYKNEINDILATKGNSSTYINMTEDEMKKIVAAQQRSTADELGYEKIGDTYYIVIKNQVSDAKIGLDLSKEERDFYIQKTHEWRKIINSNEKNIFYQVNNDQKDDASIDALMNDIKFLNGKYVVDNVLMSLNSENVKNNIYTEVITGISATGKFTYTGLSLGNVVDHEGIHVTDFLLNGGALKPVGNLYEMLNYNKSMVIFNMLKTEVLDLEYPIFEKRAMEQSEILNKINREPVIKRPFYTPDSIKNKIPLF